MGDPKAGGPWALPGFGRRTHYLCFRNAQKISRTPYGLERGQILRKGSPGGNVELLAGLGGVGIPGINQV